MKNNDLAQKIYKAAYITGDFLLRSGQRSKEYFDKYRFESNPALLKSIAQEMAKLLPKDIDGIAGLEVGGIPIATAISLETGIPVCFVRKEAKEYGTCLFAEGFDVKGKRLCVIEDVVTSGGQVIISTKDLRSAGAIVQNVLCVIDREQGGREKLEAVDLNFKSLFTMTELKGSQ
ncbi:MAG: orotate phosphoribosyltransferase [Bdellovibrionota bacterium]